jgi:hypothetical protein
LGTSSCSAMAPGVKPVGPATTSMRNTRRRSSWASAARARITSLSSIFPIYSKCSVKATQCGNSPGTCPPRLPCAGKPPRSLETTRDNADAAEMRPMTVIVLRADLGGTVPRRADQGRFAPFPYVRHRTLRPASCARDPFSHPTIEVSWLSPAALTTRSIHAGKWATNRRDVGAPSTERWRATSRHRQPRRDIRHEIYYPMEW